MTPRGSSTHVSAQTVESVENWHVVHRGLGARCRSDDLRRKASAARKERQKSARSVMVSRERKFSILLKNPRADLENEREVYKTFIAGSIPGVILSAQSLARPDGHGSGTGHLGDRSTGRNPVSGGQAGDAKAPSASAVSRSPSASA